LRIRVILKSSIRWVRTPIGRSASAKHGTKRSRTSRRESAGTLLVDGGELEIANAEAFAQGVTASVVAGQYEVTFTVAHLGAKETHDYEEYVSHAFVVLQGNGGVTTIEPLTDAHGVELGVVASEIAFAKPGFFSRLPVTTLAAGPCGRAIFSSPKLLKQSPSTESRCGLLTMVRGPQFFSARARGEKTIRCSGWPMRMETPSASCSTFSWTTDLGSLPELAR
jgi:hypothetical protein